MADGDSYAAKLQRIAPATVLPHLDAPTRQWVESLAHRYHFSLQELRSVCETARDLDMWGEEPLASWWERHQGNDTHREAKKVLLRRLQAHVDKLASQAKRYPPDGIRAPPRRQVGLMSSPVRHTILGRCPAHSVKTVCCGLHTLDAVAGCPFDCSYCTVQTFYPDNAELVSDLPGRLRELQLDPQRFYHIGTGQASDSLVWGDRAGMLDALCDFASRWPNVLLELKTKSANIEPLLDRSVPANLVCSWSLNAETIVNNEEHGTASLSQRLDAARRAADRGVLVGFHLHPMVYFEGWEREYTAVGQRLVERFTSSEVAFVSMGTMTFIKPVVQQIRRRGGQTKVLQMEMAADPHGKLTYPDEIKEQLYRCLHSALAGWRDAVFVYLCMEKHSIWQAALGWSPERSAAFEQLYGDRVMELVRRTRDAYSRSPHERT